MLGRLLNRGGGGQRTEEQEIARMAPWKAFEHPPIDRIVRSAFLSESNVASVRAKCYIYIYIYSWFVHTLACIILFMKVHSFSILTMHRNVKNKVFF